MKELLFLVMIGFLSYRAWALPIDSKPLPNWIDQTREVSDGLPPIMSGSRAEPGAGFRLAAEYEPAQAVVLGWRSYSSMLTRIAESVNNFGNAKVWIAGNPYGGTFDYESINCGLNTVWMRDYGPFGINESTREVAVVDSIYRHYSYRRDDDRLPTCMASERGMDSYALELILDGGNLLVDSKGNLFMTKRTYIWNRSMSKEQVDNMLKKYFNVHTIHALDYAGYPSSPGDGTGHIDMFVKLLDDSTVLISTGEQGSFKTNGEKAIKYFQSIKAPNGEDYKIITVKGWSSGRTWYTYTNSLIVNNLVMVPSYGGHQLDNDNAKKAYQKGIPGIKVEMINSDSSIGAGGSIHCVTQLIPRI